MLPMISFSFNVTLLTNDENGEPLVRPRRNGDRHRLNHHGLLLLLVILRFLQPRQVHLPPPELGGPGGEGAGLGVAVHRQGGVVPPKGGGLEGGAVQRQVQSWKVKDS